MGGFSVFVSFILTLFVAAAGYVTTMVSIESLRVFLDIEESARQILAALRGSAGPNGGSES